MEKVKDYSAPGASTVDGGGFTSAFTFPYSGEKHGRAEPSSFFATAQPLRPDGNRPTSGADVVNLPVGEKPATGGITTTLGKMPWKLIIGAALVVTAGVIVYKVVT